MQLSMIPLSNHAKGRGTRRSSLRQAWFGWSAFMLCIVVLAFARAPGVEASYQASDALTGRPLVDGRSIPAVELPNAPRIDGRLDPGEWQGAAKLSPLHQTRPGIGVAEAFPLHRTRP